MRIGPVPAKVALDSAAQLVSHESPEWARLRGSSYITIPEVRAGLGVTDAADHGKLRRRTEWS
jgi:hypothetical protein